MIKNVEFLLEGGRTGVLLIHGLTGTPTEMRVLGLGLHRAGMTVLGMQLAGHCGDRDDLVATGWRDWYASVEAAADRLRQRVDRVFVAGLSMGAMLALRLAEEQGDRIAGVGVLGPTFFYDGWSIPRYARYLNGLLWPCRWLGLLQDRDFDEQPPFGLKDPLLREQVAAAMRSGDSTKAGLPGNPWPSLAEMQSLSRVVRRDLPKVTSPCLVLHSSNDDVAHVRNAELVIRRVSGPARLTLMNNSYHMITIDQERSLVIKHLQRFIEECVTPERVTQETVIQEPVFQEPVFQKSVPREDGELPAEQLA